MDSSSSWCRQRLDGSLLLQQLVLLSASLAAAVKRGEARSILEVLTLIEAVPATAQLLFSSQVAVPVRRLVKRLQKQQQKQQRQAAGSVVPDEVLAKAQAMLQRWQVVLAAEVAALDSKQATRARQVGSGVLGLCAWRVCDDTSHASMRVCSLLMCAAASAPCCRCRHCRPTYRSS